MSFVMTFYFRHAHDELNSVLILKSLMACVLLIRETNDYDDGKFCLEVNYEIYTQKIEVYIRVKHCRQLTL